MTERTGVMVVRVWIETGAANGLRARLTEASDLLSGEQTSTVAATVDEIVATVRAWVEGFLAAAGGGETRSVTPP